MDTERERERETHGGTSANSSSTFCPARFDQISLQYVMTRSWKLFGTFFSVPFWQQRRRQTIAWLGPTVAALTLHPAAHRRQLLRRLLVARVERHGDRRHQARDQTKDEITRTVRSGFLLVVLDLSILLH